MGLYAVLLNTRHPNSPDNSICLVCVSNSQDYGPVLKEISEPVRAQIDQLNAVSTRFIVDFSAFEGTRRPVARNIQRSFSNIPKNIFATKDTIRGPKNLLCWERNSKFQRNRKWDAMQKVLAVVHR